jgi:hypothetical protein
MCASIAIPKLVKENVKSSKLIKIILKSDSKLSLTSIDKQSDFDIFQSSNKVIEIANNENFKIDDTYTEWSDQIKVYFKEDEINEIKNT